MKFRGCYWKDVWLSLENVAQGDHQCLCESTGLLGAGGQAGKQACRQLHASQIPEKLSGVEAGGWEGMSVWEWGGRRVQGAVGWDSWHTGISCHFLVLALLLSSWQLRVRYLSSCCHDSTYAQVEQRKPPGKSGEVQEVWNDWTIILKKIDSEKKIKKRSISFAMHFWIPTKSRDGFRDCGYRNEHRREKPCF